MKKAILFGVFALAFTWGVSHLVNLTVVSFVLAGIPITRSVLTLSLGVGLCSWLSHR